MGDMNPICTLGDYSKPSNEGYMSTIELPVRNNVVPLRSDTIWTAKLRNDILMFQQHQGESLSEAWTLGQGNLFASRCPEYIRLPPHRARDSSPSLMEAHLAPTQPTQLNKITTSCEICSGPHDTQYCIEDPEQAFVEYASLRTNEARGKNRSAFVQGEASAKIKDLGLFTLPCRLGDSKPFDTLADLGSYVSIILLYLFKKLNIGLLEETNHIFGLVDETKSYPVGIVKDVEIHIGKLKLLNDFYVIYMKKDPKTPLILGRGFLATANAVIDCRMAKIAVREGITRESYKPRPSSDGIGVQIPYYARKDFLDFYLPGEWEIARDAEINPFKDVLVFRRMVEFLGAIPINLKSGMWESKDLINNPINWNKPPKNGDGAWHAKIRLIDPDGEEFTKTLQSIPTTRKLSERESIREIIDLATSMTLKRVTSSLATRLVNKESAS
ncbi:MAK10-like protein [Tanacetum coccineum]